MSRIIHVNHFFDPHCFYFKFDDDLHDQDLQRLEDELSKNAREKLIDQNEPIVYTPDDIVAAYEISWSKWVRASVRGYDEHFQCYQLWAIDHGKLFRTQPKNIVPLPEHLVDTKVRGAVRGSLNGISPSKIELNFFTSQKELKPTDRWSDKAINQCRELILSENVMSIHFDIKEERNHCNFGTIFLKTLNKKTNKSHNVYISDALLALDEAVVVDFDAMELERIAARNRQANTGSRSSSQVGSLTEVSGLMSETSIRQVLKAASNNIQNRRQSPSQSEVARSVVASTILPSEIDGGVTRMNLKKTVLAPSVVSSVIQSTVLASEIDNGATRMNLKKSRQALAPSVILSTRQSSIVQSEIDGGVTRMRLSNKSKPNFTTNGVNGNKKPHMPAGFEPEMHNFDKYNS